MTEYAEEQADEVEALQSIYPDEFEEITKDPWSFKITVKSEKSIIDNTDEGRAIVVVEFTFGATYPDDPPKIELEVQRGLDGDQVASINSALLETANENTGMVMVYTLVTVIQDSLNTIVDERLQKIKEEKKRSQEVVTSVEALQETVVHGTPVTRETFAAWKAVFLKERGQSGADKKDITSEKKLTGRQLFEKDASLAESDMAFMDEPELATDIGAQKYAMEIDESLFMNIDDLQLEDDSD
jgi:hypothetical protein